MELADPIEKINQFLIDNYGLDTNLNIPIFRVVYSNDQTEKKLSTHTDQGVELLFPEVMELKKYPWIKNKYILERLVLVPEENQREMLGAKTSYECIFPFENAKGDALAPKIEVCQIVIDALYAALGKKSMAKYVDPDNNQDPVELREQKIREMHEELFGNETSVGDALSYKSGVVNPWESKEIH